MQDQPPQSPPCSLTFHKMSSTPHRSGTSTPPDPQFPPSSSYLTYPVSHVVTGLYRRLTEASPQFSPSRSTKPTNPSPPPQPPPVWSNGSNGVYIPPHRTASPFQPPPLTPLSLIGFDPTSPRSAQILSRALAEEIRLLLPPRLQLVDTWSLTYSLEQDGVSLATLYNKCSSPALPPSSSFVLVVRDAAGSVSLLPSSPIQIPVDLYRRASAHT